MAFFRGTSREISAAIMNGNTPTLISGVPKRTPSRATTRSQASARPSAPASTCPLAAQIVGLPSSPTSRNSRGKRSVAKCFCTSGASAAKPARLPPLEKTFSCVEVRITQRTAPSSRAASNAAIRSSSTSSDSALRVSGWSSAIVMTPLAAASWRTVPGMGGTLFLRLTAAKVEAVSNISQQFGVSTAGKPIAKAFPTSVSWCCPASP